MITARVRHLRWGSRDFVSLTARQGHPTAQSPSCCYTASRAPRTCSATSSCGASTIPTLISTRCWPATATCQRPKTHLLDAGHYLLETHSEEALALIKPFIARLAAR